MSRDALGIVSNAFANAMRENFTLFVNERQSHLGFEQHVAAVLRRIAHGEPGAVMVDAHYLLSVEAHEEELAMQRALAPKKVMPPSGNGGGAHA